MKYGITQTTLEENYLTYNKLKKNKKMIISDNKKFIFFHLYKTAGTSLSEILKKYKNPSQTPKHYKVSDYIKIIGREKYDNFFTFGFVRNPWDWQVSLYHYMLMDVGHFQHKLIKSFKTYDDYLDWRVHEDCKPQYTFFSENADLVSPITLNLIGRFESLDDDVNTIKNKLSLVGEMPHLVKSKRTHYRDYYNEKTKKMIKEAYSKDVEYFNYEF